jgi:hypothetical protein
MCRNAALQQFIWCRKFSAVKQAGCMSHLARFLMSSQMHFGAIKGLRTVIFSVVAPNRISCVHLVAALHVTPADFHVVHYRELRGYALRWPIWDAYGHDASTILHHDKLQAEHDLEALEHQAFLSCFVVSYSH